MKSEDSNIVFVPLAGPISKDELRNLPPLVKHLAETPGECLERLKQEFSKLEVKFGPQLARQIWDDASNTKRQAEILTPQMREVLRVVLEIDPTMICEKKKLARAIWERHGSKVGKSWRAVIRTLQRIAALELPLPPQGLLSDMLSEVTVLPELDRVGRLRILLQVFDNLCGGAK
jgi:hypothetical protein